MYIFFQSSQASICCLFAMVIETSTIMNMHVAWMKPTHNHSWDKPQCYWNHSVLKHKLLKLIKSQRRVLLRSRQLLLSIVLMYLLHACSCKTNAWWSYSMRLFSIVCLMPFSCCNVQTWPLCMATPRGRITWWLNCGKRSKHFYVSCSVLHASVRLVLHGWPVGIHPPSLSSHDHACMILGYIAASSHGPA